MVNTRRKYDAGQSSSGWMSLRSRDSARNKKYVELEQRDRENVEVNMKDEDVTDNVDTDSSRQSECHGRRSKGHDDSDDDDFVSMSRLHSAPPGATPLVQRRSSRSQRKIYTSLNADLISKSHEASQDLDDVVDDVVDERSSRTRHSRRIECNRDNRGVEEGMYSRPQHHRTLHRPYTRNCRRLSDSAEPHVGEAAENDDSGDDNVGDENGEDNEEDNEDENEDDQDDDDEDEDKMKFKSYNLRERRQHPQRFQAPLTETKTRRRMRLSDDHTPGSRRQSRYDAKVYRSPAHRRPLNTRKKAAFHGSSSTSSSSDDDQHFERRKAKSMIRARNRCLPMNLTEGDVASGTMRDRVKIGSSLADVDPMTIDRSVTFESVGGLGKHIRSLKEMVIFPLLYPEVFEKFKISPPRGVLFYGPPGTGKTLVARALANESSQGDNRVAFFMRKGADCLSKWVGESERQLRLLFDQAYQMRPSIIFFDEIDGLAPVRSSRQDQIHSSIVSTLLALMDGLDSRGEVVIIGATNRIDSIDPALRRPGRFDREFLFPLPSVDARTQILSIHTKEWMPRLSEVFVRELAERCVGYCGADLKAMCTEAALVATRRRYPQIYTSREKLELNLDAVTTSRRDFLAAMATIVPTAQRATVSPSVALAACVQPLLRTEMATVLRSLRAVYPAAVTHGANVCEAPEDDRLSAVMSDSEDDSADIHALPSTSQQTRPRSIHSSAFDQPPMHRPRLLLTGSPGQGQTTHVAPAILHDLERLPVYTLDLPTLYGASAKTPEESCAQVFQEARRTSPSVLYMPRLDQWWSVLPDTLRSTLLSLVSSIPPASPLLVLATSDSVHPDMDDEIGRLFDPLSGEVHEMSNPDVAARKEYFESLIMIQAARAPRSKRKAALRILEVLPKAAPPKPRELTASELTKLRSHEDETMRELRIFLRDVLNKLLNEKKLLLFAKPVSTDDVPDYYNIIKQPMDLGTMMSKIDQCAYLSVKDFLTDINLICGNALEYNPDTDASGRMIRHRACALRDTAHSIIKGDLDPEFEKICTEVIESMEKRGESPSKNAPPHVFTRPAGSHLYGAYSNVIADYPSRYSRRLRGMQVESKSRVWRDNDDDDHDGLAAGVTRRDPDHEGGGEKSRESPPLVKRKLSVDESAVKMDVTKHSPKKRKVCIWARPSRKWHVVKRNRMLARRVQEEELGKVVKDEEDGHDSNALSTIEERSDDRLSPLTPHKHNSPSLKSHSPCERRKSPSVKSCSVSPRVETTVTRDSQLQLAPAPLMVRHTDGTAPSDDFMDYNCVADLVKRRHSSPLVNTALSVDVDCLSVVQGPRSHSPRVKRGCRTLGPMLLTVADRASPMSGDAEPTRASTRTSRSPARYTPPCMSPRDTLATNKTDGSHRLMMDTDCVEDKAALTLNLPKEGVALPGDSGVGSSMESNGDSRDSISDQCASLKVIVTTPEKSMDVDEATSSSVHEDTAVNVPPPVTPSTTPPKQISDARGHLNSGKTAASDGVTSYHVTRSCGVQGREAMEVLATPEPPLVVDKARLARLLARTVERTRDYNVERLEKIYGSLGRLVYARRGDHDKTQLTQELEQAVARLTQPP